MRPPASSQTARSWGLSAWTLHELSRVHPGNCYGCSPHTSRQRHTFAARTQSNLTTPFAFIKPCCPEHELFLPLLCEHPPFRTTRKAWQSWKETFRSCRHFEKQEYPVLESLSEKILYLNCSYGDSSCCGNSFKTKKYTSQSGVLSLYTLIMWNLFLSAIFLI